MTLCWEIHLGCFEGISFPAQEFCVLMWNCLYHPIFSQGVTLTDLQEAEKTFSRSRAERQAQEQPGEKLEDSGELEGSTKKQEPSAAPTKEAGEGQQPWGRSLDEEVSSFCQHALPHKHNNLVNLHQWWLKGYSALK